MNKEKNEIEPTEQIEETPVKKEEPKARKTSLAVLTGTEKQVSFAGGIRLRKIDALELYFKTENLTKSELCRNIIKTAEQKITSAAAWIRLNFEAKTITDLINALGIEASTDADKLARLTIEIENDMRFKSVQQKNMRFKSVQEKKLLSEAKKMFAGAEKNHYENVALYILVELVAARTGIVLSEPAKIDETKLALAYKKAGVIPIAHISNERL